MRRKNQRVEEPRGLRSPGALPLSIVCSSFYLLRLHTELQLSAQTHTHRKARLLIMFYVRGINDTVILIH